MVDPSPEVKIRLLASSGGGRFEPFAAQLQALFDVGEDRVHDLLGLIERSASWVQLGPGVAMLHFAGGPAATTAHCAFLRLASGAAFPPHSHHGEESALVMSGRVLDGDQVVETGGGWTLAAGTRHALRNAGDDECICAVRATGGILLG